jgi:hypothetical protein
LWPKLKESQHPLSLLRPIPGITFLQATINTIAGSFALFHFNTAFLINSQIALGVLYRPTAPTAANFANGNATTSHN